MYIAQKYYETKASINYQECWGDDKISILITSFPNLDVNVIDKTGSTLLHYAVMSKNLLLTSVLLNKKCNVNVQTTDDKWSPLHEICYKGDLEMLKIFCESKQKINPNIKNNVGRTPLHYLVGVGPNKRPSLFPALHPQASHFDILAHEKNTKVRLEMLTLLAQHRAVVTTEDDNGNSPLQFAQAYGHNAFILEMGKLIEHHLN